MTRPETASGWKGTLVSASNTVDRLTQAAYIGFTFIFFVIMLMGVFFRYVLNDSLSWSGRARAYRLYLGDLFVDCLRIPS